MNEDSGEFVGRTNLIFSSYGLGDVFNWLGKIGK